MNMLVCTSFVSLLCGHRLRSLLSRGFSFFVCGMLIID